MWNIFQVITIISRTFCPETTNFFFAVFFSGGGVVTHSKERSFACRSRPRCVTLSVDLSSVNYERYSGDAGKSVNSGDRRGGLCVRDVD